VYNNARGVTVKTVISGLESITILKYIIQWPQGTTVHVSRAQTLLVYFNMVSYGGHNSGAKALTDHPYSVILKGAKNTETNGRVNVSQFRPADRRPKSKRQ
jgi:hypothetical protein